MHPIRIPDPGLDLPPFDPPDDARRARRQRDAGPDAPPEPHPKHMAGSLRVSTLGRSDALGDATRVTLCWLALREGRVVHG